MTKKEKEGKSNIYSLENLLSFPTKVINNNNNNNNKKKTKTLVECNCWVCKILDSSAAVVTNVTATSTKHYEAYNIVSETGDSIYSPLYEELIELLDDDVGEDQIFVSEVAIEEVVNRLIDQKRLGSSINNNKNGN